MMKRWLFIAIVIAIFLPAHLRASSEEVLVITARKSAEKLSIKDLRRIYLKRKVLWKDGSKIVPVNLPSTNNLRKAFSHEILGMGHRELVDYWNEQHFKGVRPPVVLDSEEAVKAFVKEVEGAVGYISSKNREPGLIILYRIQVEK